MAGILQAITLGSDEPKDWEETYRSALGQGQAAAFAEAMLERYQSAPHHPLYAAWYYRLQGSPTEAQAGESAIPWRTAIPLALLTGLIFALLSNTRFTFANGMPYLLLLWSPIVAVTVYLFMVLENPEHRQRALPALGSVLAVGAYGFSLSLWRAGESYQTLILFHLPLLAWIGIGWGLYGWRSSAHERFAGLLKSVEIGITGGVFGIAVGLFVAITLGLFEALGINVPDRIIQAFFAGAPGLVPVIAVAVAYHPHRRAWEQRFEQGLGRLVPILMRLLLPLTLLVLVIYLCFIPFNFMGPFRNRDLLIVYNVMLFAVMGLLVGATPMHVADLSPRYQGWLRNAILAVAGLSMIIGLYALAAVIYRTGEGGLTPNRLAVIGWNAINIGLLAMLLYQQGRNHRTNWVETFQRVVSTGLVIYAAWALILVLTLPFLFPAV